ncbi:MAG: GYF domain-containing protein [Myxococcota bacterium]
MKIVCDSCSAKYSIADEKVAGKVFKIRCKKCSAVIVVRGDQLDSGGAAQPEAAPEAAPDAVWHLVIDGDQQGPFAPPQVGEMLSAGTIDWEAYVWREGFDGWLAARDVPELVEAVTGQPAQQDYGAAAGGGFDAAAPVAAAAADPGLGADPFAASGSADPFAATQAPDAGGGVFASAAEPEAKASANVGADLFAQSSSASPFDGGADDDVVASAPSPRVSGDQAMTGQRNENSVLFSLSNLQALATGAPDAGAVPASSPAPAAAKPGHASGEGSGLIDIRALASTGAAGPSMGAAPAPKDNVDDLLSIGTGSPLGSSLGAPVLAPVQEEKSNNTVLISIIAAAAIAVIAIAAVAIVIVTNDPDPAQATNTQGAGVITPGEPQATGEPAGATATMDEAPTEAANDGNEPEETADSDEGAETSASDMSSARDRRRDRDRDRRPSGSMTSAAMESAPAPTMMTSVSMGSSDIDDLLNAALGGMGSMSSPMMAAPMASGGNLPATPPRDAVARALRSVQGAVSRCGNGQHGVANTSVTVSGSTGRVTSARVSGQFAGTPVGSCVARAVRGARFPRFSRPTFSVTFPYRI